MRPSVRVLLGNILKIAGLGIIAFAATALLIGFFYGNDIKNLLLANLNKNLNTEIQVEKIDFSILRHFPYASVELENVIARDAVADEKKDTLLHGGHISLLFNLTGIFSKDISIKQIILKNSHVKIWVDEKGKSNYHFWKVTDDASGSSVNLQKVILEKVSFVYHDALNHQRYSFMVKKSEVKGAFSKSEFELAAGADLFVNYFYSGSVNYVAQKEAKLKSSLHVNTVKGLYRIEKSRIQIADLVLDAGGEITVLPESTKLNLKINSHQSELADMLTLLPASLTGYFSHFRTHGKVTCQATVTGDAGNGKHPDVMVAFNLAGGSLNPVNSTMSLEDLEVNGSLISHSSGPSQLVINSFNGKLSGRQVGGNLRISNFENPYLTLYTKADIDLNSLRAFISHDTLESLDGDLFLHVNFAGNLKELGKYDLAANYKSNTSGTIRFDNVSFKLKENPLQFRNIKGDFSLNDNNIGINSLDGMISSTDFHLSGVCRNFIPFILIPGQEADIRATITSSLIELNELLSNKTTSSASDTSYKLKINPRLICNLDISASKLVFRKFEAKEISGIIRIQDEVISTPGLDFKSMDGDVRMSAAINASRNDSVLMSCKADFRHLDITRLFSEMENFGQNTITDQNLKGNFSAAVDFRSSWTNDLVINPARVIVNADLTVDNGELNNFKPILALSKYLKLADLRRIQFSTLKNHIDIRNRMIYFPAMEIKSSALNLNASGTHDFDNIVEYKLNMLLSDVLGKKVKDQTTEFGIIEDDGLGRSKLFLSMKGPMDNPRFAYDQRGVSQKIKTDLAADRQNVKQLLKQEFGMFKKDTTLRAEKKKKEEMQIDWEEK